MRYVPTITLILLLASCGPNKEVLMETKLDGPLKEQMTMLEQEGAEEKELTIVGVCDTTINGAMRQAIVSAGGQALKMNGNEFTAKVQSSMLYDIADLEFVRSLRMKKPK